ncbi:MAG: hypothetical protein ABFD75_13125 [Smithella sp.]
MKRNIMKRIELLEKVTSINSVPEKDRVIAITYPDGDKEEFNRKLHIRLAQLQKKYGLGIKKDDFLVIGIRQLFSKKTEEERI